MRKSFLAILFAGMILMSASAYADVTITATVGNQAPTITFVNVCDGACEAQNTLAPATDVTIEVTVTDPNGADDIDTATFSVEIYTTGDVNGSGADWDAIVVSATAGTRDDCDQAGDTYCLQVDAGDWTTKFLAGNADVYVYVTDDSGAMSSAEETDAIIVDATEGLTSDATTGTYSGSPDSTDNVFVSEIASNPYIVLTHNANVDLLVTADQENLDGSGAIYIGDDNVSWNLVADGATSTAFTGSADTVMAEYSRGIDSDSNTLNVWMYLDIPADTPADDYVGTLAIVASDAS